MRNGDLVRSFINGACEGKGSNLQIRGNRLINYTTCIAYRVGSLILLNGDHYSATTSRHQNLIRREGYKVEEMSEENLKKYVFETYEEVI